MLPEHANRQMSTEQPSLTLKREAAQPTILVFTIVLQVKVYPYYLVRQDNSLQADAAEWSAVYGGSLHSDQ